MVLPVIITGGAVVGGASGYAMYTLGQSFALPKGVREAPSKSLLSLTIGSAASIGAYKGQSTLLSRHFSHLTKHEVPAAVEAWKFRDFARVMGPFMGSRILMFSTSLAVFGFTSTKIDLLRSKAV